MACVLPVLLALAFADTVDLAKQIRLDRAGFSCNVIDGAWGAKSARALEAAGGAVPADGRALFRFDTVTEADLSAVAKLPRDPSARAQLPRLGYESLAEMFAERGHLSVRALERLNPQVDWSNVRAGTRIRIPDFPSIDEELSVWPKNRRGAPVRPEAALVKISLSRFEVTAWDASGRLLALFPCSIARDKAKLPSVGTLKITTPIARPNYTYTPVRFRKDERRGVMSGPRARTHRSGSSGSGSTSPVTASTALLAPRPSVRRNRTAASGSRTGTPPASTPSVRPAPGFKSVREPACVSLTNG